MGDRSNNQCVGENTVICLSEKYVGQREIDGHTEQIERAKITNVVTIKEIGCNFIQRNDGGFAENPAYNNTKHMIITINGTAVTPLYTYKYTYEPDEPPPLLYEITAKIDPTKEDDPGYTLLATEWHPIMRNHNSVTFASLLSWGDSVLTIDGIASVTNIKEIKEERNVCGLALGDLTSSARFGINLDQFELNQVGGLLNTQMRNWATFGLPCKEQIIFTNGIATGGLAIQHQLSEILSNGISLTAFV
jgi:hypothetical protein